MTMKLLGSSRSPYVQKVRIAMVEKGLTFEYDAALPNSDEVTGANPLAKIPTLIRDDGRGLYDSSVIVEYVDGCTGAPTLLPMDFDARIEARRWEALGNGVTDAAVQISHEHRAPTEQRKGPDFVAKHQRKIDAGLDAMERDMGASGFCMGASFTLADVGCASALLYLDLAQPDLKWRETHPKLAKAFAQWKERPSLKALG